MTDHTQHIRDLLEQALEVIVANTTGKDDLEAAIRAELAKPAPTPAWHDAPTCAGLWMCDEGQDNPYRWTTHSVKFPISPLLVGEDERWFGPIPQDAKAEGGAE